MKPKEIVEAWVGAFNRADVEALASLYSESAVNHQVAEAAIEGRAAIRQMFAREFARTQMVWFFHVQSSLIQFQRGYWDKLSFLRLHKLPLPST